jgi:hypothetical protein
VLAEPPGIDFADATGLEPDADALTDGIAVSICNSTAQEQSVQLSLEQFTFTAADTGKELGTGEVIVVEPLAEPIPPGGCRDATLRWSHPEEPPALKDTTYSGSMLAVSNGGGSARLDLTIPGASKSGKATGALDPFELQGSFAPFGSSGEVHLQSRTLLLRYTGEVAPTIAKDTLLAVIGHRSDAATIITTADSEVVEVNDDAKIISVPVEVSHVGGNGTFHGEVETAVAGTEDEPVAVTLTVRDGIGLLLFWLVIGLAVGFLIKLVSGRYMPWLRIRTFRRSVGSDYEKALNSFKGAAPTFEDHFAVGSAVEWEKKIGEATRRYKGSTLLFDKTNAALKAILDDLAAARTDAALLANRGDGGLHKALEDLQTALKDLVIKRRRIFAGAPRAAVELQAHKLLGEGPQPVVIPIGGAGNIQKQAVGATALLRAWIEWASEHDRYRRWAFALRDTIGDPSDRQRQRDLATLRRLDDRLREVLFEMLDGETETDFTVMGIEGELRLVYTTLASLAGRYGVYFAEHLEVEAPDYLHEDYVGHGLSKYTAAAFEPHDLDLDVIDSLELSAELQAKVPSLTITAAHVRQMAEVAAGASVFVLEVIIAVVALALACATTILPLYVDQPFGTPSDYFKVFVIGGTAQLLTSGLFNVIRAWRDPSAAAET